MDLLRRCNYISNSYYNKGLKLAQENDLTNAAEALKNALKFNKRNTDARNLLGLIYYQIGEVADALVQWVLSLNLQPTNNDADRYLDEVQRTPGLVESYKKAISDFNQTLAQAQGGSDDLAILQLSKIATNYHNYLRPHLLLGLLNMANGQYNKAYKNFQSVLRIDRGNLLASRCVDELKLMQREKAGSKKSIKDSISKDKSKKPDNEIPSMEPYRENTFWQTIANIIMGLIIGAAAVLFVYLPIKEASISREYNQQVIAISEELNEANNKISQLEKDNAALKGDYDTLNDSSSKVGDELSAKLSSFQMLAGAIKAFDNGDIKKAAELYSDINPEYIKDVEDGSSASVEHYYSQLKAYFDEKGYQDFIKDGDKLYNQGLYEDAISLYDLSIAVHEENPEAIYKKGLSYLKAGNTTQSTELFNEVIDKFPDSKSAELAKEERGY